MVAHAFLAHVKPDGTLRVPEEVTRQLSPGQSVRVLVLVREPTEDEDGPR